MARSACGGQPHFALPVPDLRPHSRRHKASPPLHRFGQVLTSDRCIAADRGPHRASTLYRPVKVILIPRFPGRGPPIIGCHQAEMVKKKVVPRPARSRTICGRRAAPQSSWRPLGRPSGKPLLQHMKRVPLSLLTRRRPIGRMAVKA